MARVKLWFHPMASEVYYPHFVLIRASNHHSLSWASWVWSSWATSSTQIVPIAQLGQAVLPYLLGWHQGWGTHCSLRKSRRRQLLAWSSSSILFSLICSSSSCCFGLQPYWLCPWDNCCCSCKHQRCRAGRVSSSERATHSRSNSSMGLCTLLPRMRQKSNILYGRVCKSPWRACGISPSFPGLQTQRDWSTSCPFTSCIPASAHKHSLKLPSCLQQQKAETTWD